MDDNLGERLKRLGVMKGLKALQSAPAASQPEPETARGVLLPGEEVATEHGPVWVERRVYPAVYPHGRYVLGEVRQLSADALVWLGVSDLGARPAFLDTETTGLAGGAGTLVFLTGIGVWKVDHLTLHLVFLRSPDEERAAMHYVADVLSGATGIVSFNGNGFDLPLLETRFILNRMAPRWRALPHLDLLPVARQLWRDHLPSRRLGVLETEILRMQRAEADIESSLIPWLYRHYLDTGRTAEMARVFYHNRVDVLSLVSLLVHVARVVAAPERMALSPGEWAGVGRVYDRAGRETETFAAWERALAQETGTLDEACAARLWQEMGVRYKRREAWECAFSMWDAWSEWQSLAVEPLVERAKYYEWTARNLDAALAETDAALRRAARHPVGIKRTDTLAALRHRKARLERKLEKKKQEARGRKQEVESRK